MPFSAPFADTESIPVTVVVDLAVPVTTGVGLSRVP
jgi:hypothetical protein